MLITKFLSKYRYFSNRYSVMLFDEGLLKLNGSAVRDFHTNIAPGDRIDILIYEDISINKKKDPRIAHERQTIIVDFGASNIEDTRIWRMYKPRGCLVTRYDAQGRSTIFDLLPSNLSNVRNIIAIGRLDYNSEGLLLLTNDGHFARKMSLPATNIQRVYNCRISRNIRDDEIESLSKGMTISSGSYRPIYAKRLDRDNGTFRIDDGALRERVNQWIQLRLNEGKNREIRNVLKAFGIEVSRLIRISYGPFRLDGLRQGDIIEDSAWRGNSKLRL